MINSLDSFLHSGGASLFSSQPCHSHPCGTASSSPALPQLDLAPGSPLGLQGQHSHSVPFNIMYGGSPPGGGGGGGVRHSRSHPGLLDLGSFVGADQTVEQGARPWCWCCRCAGLPPSALRRWPRCRRLQSCWRLGAQ
jgi:hypothetical protein